MISVTAELIFFSKLSDLLLSMVSHFSVLRKACPCMFPPITQHYMACVVSQGPLLKYNCI